MSAINYAVAVSLLSIFAVSSVQAADIHAGKSRAALCMGCHGGEGISTSPMFPNLAGQQSIYLETQLKSFREGRRKNQTMNAIANGLTDSDIQNLAAYFAGLPAKATVGSTLAQDGKEKLAMCMGCHGNKLQGNGQFPWLAGQHAQYLSKQLRDFKTGERKAGPMNVIAKNLSDAEIKDLAEYLASF